MTPILDIIIPVYNAEKFIDKCLDSIVSSERFDNYRLVIINDGSTDNTIKIIHQYSKRYVNIDVLSRENKGIVYTLNEALSLCNAKYIARMDADDIVLPGRFVKQIQYLEDNEDVSIVGASFNIIDETGRYLSTSRPPTKTEQIKAYALFGSPLCHPSIMLRGDIVYKGLYRYKDEPLCEDYCLWLRLLSKIKINNLNEVVMHYRMNEESLSNMDKSKQVFNTLKNRDLSLLLDLNSQDSSVVDDLFSPRLSKVSSYKYAFSILKFIPTIIKSDISLFWYLVYGVNGLIIKLGIRR